MTHWIWHDQGVSVNEYAIARCSFDAEKWKSPELLVSADSDFAAYLNGEFLGRGQFSDFPDRRTFTRIPLASALSNGVNELEIHVHYCGSDFLTHLAGTPRLWAEVRDGETLLAATGRDWQIARHPAFRCGPIEQVNIMLGYTWEYDARKENTAVFAPAVELDIDEVPFERPVPMLPPGKPLLADSIFHGYFRRQDPNAYPGKAVIEDMVAPLVHKFEGEFGPLPEGADGWMTIYDLGRNETGLMLIDVEAPEGTVLDVAHGEHIWLGRVLAAYNNNSRTYTDRYICKEGRNRFTYCFRRYGCRYLEIHVTGMKQGAVKIHQFTLQPTELPLPPPAAFESPDRLLMQSHRVGERTLHLCMHEHYEDCPSREQSLYGYDSRNQMLFGYYAYGNYDFAAASLDLLGLSMQENGFLTLTAPGLKTMYIPIFTFAWIAAIYEHQMYSGDRSLFARWQAAIRQAIPKFMARPTAEGLYLPPLTANGVRCWSFCEWVDGLDGNISDWNLDVDGEVPTAFFNLYLVEALRAVAAMAGDGDLHRQAEELGSLVEKTFWDEAAGCYRTRLGDDRLHAHIQYLMLALDLVPESRKERVIESAMSEKLLQVTFSTYIYMIRALVAAGRSEALEAKLRADFDRMTLTGADTFWETGNGYRGTNGRGYGGRLCHAWSCAGLLFDGAYRLGVIPLTPGFETFSLAIHPAGEDRLSGEVPTPHGMIRVAWRKTAYGKIRVQLSYPEGTRPRYIAPDIELAEQV